MNIIIKIYNKFLWILHAVSPAMMLIIRLWMAHIFWNSGMVKISDWDSTLYLFANEYSVPLLPPAVAAVFATCFELACPVLLTLGLATRLATLPMLAMTAIINFTYQNLDEHYYWAMLLGMILFYGPNKWSADYLIGRRIKARQAQHV